MRSSKSLSAFERKTRLKNPLNTSDGPWDRDGHFACETGRIPVAGYITAAIQSANDNQVGPTALGIAYTSTYRPV